MNKRSNLSCKLTSKSFHFLNCNLKQFVVKQGFAPFLYPVPQKRIKEKAGPPYHLSAGVSNSNHSVGHSQVCIVIGGPHKPEN